jgi:hypothetical protein
MMLVGDGTTTATVLSLRNEERRIEKCCSGSKPISIKLGNGKGYTIFGNSDKWNLPQPVEDIQSIPTATYSGND